MKITLLGTGTPAPSLTRQSSSYLVEVGEDVIVLDHGPGAQHRLLEAGRHPTEVTHAFLSHLHYDHILDYPRLVLQRWDMGAGRIPELKVFGPPPLARINERLLGDDGAFGLDIESRVSHRASLDVFVSRGGVLPRRKPRPEVTEVTPGDVVEGSGWRVVVGAASHFQPILECLGYRLETPGGTLTYSGDSGGVPDSMVELATDCDVLIHMCHFRTGMEPSEGYRQATGSHMDVAEVARRARARTLVLTHMIPMLDRPGTLERMVQEMRDVYSGEIIIGRDLMEIPLGTAAPRRID
ncbi:MAG: MBL fold metallo-hydrolase [Ectothiorhodospiraceae bacterium]|nr:MBL fold metallo-hydrolase [Chromatiales bacterium]MCP5154024.1 MBL fold metallo-hydrolase [Ectothiorhodospiraceae bacterium]